ncbi:MAG TPA: TonB family protein [Phenylobacterium sp.]
MVSFPTSDPTRPHLGAVGPFYPVDAIEERRNGDVTIECIVAATGRLSDCRVISESRRGVHFGDAARAMAKRGWILAPAGTVVTDQPVQLLVPFRMKGGRGP